MALVYEQQEILREVIQQGKRRGAGRSAGQDAGIVLDSRAYADLLEHLHIVMGALLYALGLQQLALTAEVLQPLLELALQLGHGAAQLIAVHYIMRGGIYRGVAQVGYQLAGEGVDLGHAVYLVAKEFHPDNAVGAGRGEYLYDISAHAELVADKVDIIALILELDQLTDQLVAGLGHPRTQRDHHITVINRVAQRINAGHRRNDDNVAALGQRQRSAVAQFIYLVVYGGVLLDIGIALRDVSLRLVIIVVTDEILYRVLRKELLELGAELSRQGLVVSKNKCGAVHLSDDVRHGEGLSGAGDSEQGLLLVAGFYALDQPADGGGLISGRGIFRYKLEMIHNCPSLRIFYTGSHIHVNRCVGLFKQTGLYHRNCLVVGDDEMIDKYDVYRSEQLSELDGGSIVGGGRQSESAGMVMSHNNRMGSVAHAHTHYLAVRESRGIEAAVRDESAEQLLTLLVHQQQQDAFLMRNADKLLDEVVPHHIIIDYLGRIVVPVEQIQAGNVGDQLDIRRLVAGQAGVHKHFERGVKNCRQ